MRMLPAGFLAQFGERFELGGDFLETWRDRQQQAFAGLGRRNAAGAAGEQAQPETFFQTSHRVAQRRLRHTQARRRTGEAALAGDRDEGDEIGDVFAFHS
jgi:hypothetical protein